MAQLFQIYTLESIVRDDTGKTINNNQFFHYPKEAENALEALLKSHGINTVSFIAELQTSFELVKKLPWGMILFPVDYPIGWYFQSLRRYPADILYSNYWCRKEQIPKVISNKFLSQIYVFKKKILSDMAKKTEFLRPYWDILRDKEENHAWMIIADKIPEKIVDEMRTDMLFQRG